MPQLKKIALVMGNQVIYTDTYDQALAQLTATMQGISPPPAAPAAEAAPAPAAAQPPPPAADQRLESIRQHLRRYRDFASQGRWAEAGKELEAIESEASRR
jgi:uncharacterized membrane protein (UPF0182 family)